MRMLRPEVERDKFSFYASRLRHLIRSSMLEKVLWMRNWTNEGKGGCRCLLKFTFWFSATTTRSRWKYRWPVWKLKFPKWTAQRFTILAPSRQKTRQFFRRWNTSLISSLQSFRPLWLIAGKTNSTFLQKLDVSFVSLISMRNCLYITGTSNGEPPVALTRLGRQQPSSFVFRVYRSTISSNCRSI